jgi:hypothetical protein
VGRTPAGHRLPLPYTVPPSLNSRWPYSDSQLMGFSSMSYYATAVRWTDKLNESVRLPRCENAPVHHQQM